MTTDDRQDSRQSKISSIVQTQLLAQSNGETMASKARCKAAGCSNRNHTGGFCKKHRHQPAETPARTSKRARNVQDEPDREPRASSSSGPEHEPQTLDELRQMVMWLSRRDKEQTEQLGQIASTMDAMQKTMETLSNTQTTLVGGVDGVALKHSETIAQLKDLEERFVFESKQITVFKDDILNLQSTVLDPTVGRIEKIASQLKDLEERVGSESNYQNEVILRKVLGPTTEHVRKIVEELVEMRTEQTELAARLDTISQSRVEVDDALGNTLEALTTELHQCRNRVTNLEQQKNNGRVTSQSGDVTNERLKEMCSELIEETREELEKIRMEVRRAIERLAEETADV